MPRYQLRVDVPAQTGEASAVTDSVSVDEQVVTDGVLYVDPGAADEVRAQLRFGDRPLLPAEGSDLTTIPGDTDPAPIQVTLPGVPQEVQLRAWAPNADNSHVVLGRFDTVEVSESRPLLRLLEAFQPDRPAFENPANPRPTPLDGGG